MPDTPNVFTTFAGEHKPDAIVEPGDVALVLKRDGSCQALNFGYDASRFHLPADQQTDDDRDMMKLGRRLFALALAASHPVLMQMLEDIASDPEVVDFEKLHAVVRLH
ncbi:hypothetical protein [Agrobacterium sp. CG674]